MENNYITIAGIKCYKNKPENIKLADMSDFHTQGEKNVGMKYFLKSCYSNYYEEYTVLENLKAEDIKVYFDYNMVFVFND